MRKHDIFTMAVLINIMSACTDCGANDILDVLHTNDVTTDKEAGEIKGVLDEAILASLNNHNKPKRCAGY